LVDAENLPEGRERDEAVKSVLGSVRAVVGIEADVGDRADWADWWPRPVSCFVLVLSETCDVLRNVCPAWTGPVGRVVGGRQSLVGAKTRISPIRGGGAPRD
jgi:hypothetical protein